jgi:hypothetical protein
VFSSPSITSLCNLSSPDVTRDPNAKPVSQIRS